ncbi:hypothetical protein PIB30_091572 [Stylosanthes scabra]|uniref:Uncharacterized protein n=1 Tax=Stylosanthes scabra TaxID=79078 RepID=A0ABU6RUI6_9FABA|nr:hypothetical protein [Stylosanthes scabra]
MTRGDRGRGRGDRGRGSGGRRGRPKKRTSVLLDLEQVDPPPTQGTATSPPPVIPTSSLSEGLPAMRMIPNPGSRLQSSDTPRTRGHTQTTSAPTSSQSAHGHDDDSDAQPPPEPDPMPYPPVENPLPEGEEEDIAAEEAAAAQAGRVYLRWGGGNWLYVRQFSQAPEHVVQFWWDRWRRAAKRLRELFYEIRKKGAPHGWIPENIFGRLVEFWWQEDFKRLQQTNTKNQTSETGGSMHTGESTHYPATRERMSLEMGQTPSFSEVFARTHTRKKDREWVDKRSHDYKEAFEAEKNRLEAERQAIIDGGNPEPPDR